jgi:SAM-dependent methyltransferase
MLATMALWDTDEKPVVLRAMGSQPYTKSFFERLRSGATRSAEVVAPLVLQLLPVHSVVDVGCGDGSWLAVFRKLGIEEILGIDGGYVDRSLLQIPEDSFQAFDLTKPLRLGRAFDLAVSLEVAEHLPPESAAIFVESLTRLAPLVLFSAAIPFQVGDHHVNEQWPDKWAELFRGHGYLPVDFIRKRIWQNDAVEWWYAQNTLLFAQEKLIESNAALKAELEQTNLNQLRLVHPKQHLYHLYLEGLHQQALVRAQQPPPPPSGLREASRLLLVCLRNAARCRLNSMINYGRKLKGKIPPI